MAFLKKEGKNDKRLFIRLLALQHLLILLMFLGGTLYIFASVKFTSIEKNIPTFALKFNSRDFLRRKVSQQEGDG